MLAHTGALINNVVIGMFFVLSGIFLRPTAPLRGHCVDRRDRDREPFRPVQDLSGGCRRHGIRRARAPGCDRMVAMLIGVYAIGMGYVPQAMRQPGFWLRLAFVSDAVSSWSYVRALASATEGVVRWRYVFPGMPVFTFLPDPSTMTPDRMLEALRLG